MPAGEHLAQFEILEELGEGELGAVYKARDTAEGREVEIEILRSGQGFDTDRLRQEVAAARALDHWNIAKTYDLARAGDTDFLVRESVAGAKLAGPMGYAAALDCARQIAGALAAGHALGVTHRHLSPANIVLGSDGAVKLINFGLTPRAADARYLAPEQIDGRGADARADIYAFGKVLREIAGPAAPRPLEKIIARSTQRSADRRYQLMEDIRQELERLAAATPADSTEPGRRILLWVGGAVAAILILGWWLLAGRSALHRGPSALTADSGLTTEAAISPDGRVVAYASDRLSPGTLHIWTQPASGGQAARLTDGVEDDHQPAIAPDGTRVVFRSERDGGGLYGVPIRGGAPQLLVRGGRDPRYSPDGRWIAYWTGEPLARDGAVWVIAASGGDARRVRPEFPDARYPVWSSDGKHLLFAGHTDVQPISWMGDWFVAPFLDGSTGGRLVRTGAQTLLRMQQLGRSREGNFYGAFAIPEAWMDGQVLFAGRMTPFGRASTGAPHVLRIPINPSILEASGAAHEVTAGAETDSHPSVSRSGRLMFTRGRMKAEIWSMAADGSGDPRLVVAEADDVRPAVSRDGTRLAYQARNAGGDEIRVVELDSGRQIARLPEPTVAPNSILLSPAGDEVLFNGRRGIMRQPLPEGDAEFLRIRGPWNRVTSWSPDGAKLLAQGWRGLAIVNPETGEAREFLRTDRDSIVESHFSPDGKWVAFAIASHQRTRIYAAAVSGGDAPWIEMTDEDSGAGSPAWSRDGGRLFFTRQCEGFRCIWARRFDARRGQPAGEPFAVRHFHHARWSLVPTDNAPSAGLAAAGDKLVFGMFENTGNVWSLASMPRP